MRPNELAAELLIIGPAFDPGMCPRKYPEYVKYIVKEDNRLDLIVAISGRDPLPKKHAYRKGANGGNMLLPSQILAESTPDFKMGALL